MAIKTKKDKGSEKSDNTHANLDTESSSSESEARFKGSIEKPFEEAIRELMNAGKHLDEANAELKNKIEEYSKKNMQLEKENKSLKNALEKIGKNSELQLRAQRDSRTKVLQTEQKLQKVMELNKVLSENMNKAKSDLLNAMSKIHELSEDGVVKEQRLVALEKELGEQITSVEQATENGAEKATKVMEPIVHSAFEEKEELLMKNKELETTALKDSNKLALANKQIEMLLKENSVLKEEKEKSQKAMEQESQHLKGRVQQYMALVELSKENSRKQLEKAAKVSVKREQDLLWKIKQLEENENKLRKELNYVKTQSKLFNDRLLRNFKRILNNSLSESENDAKSMMLDVLEHDESLTKSGLRRTDIQSFGDINKKYNDERPVQTLGKRNGFGIFRERFRRNQKATNNQQMQVEKKHRFQTGGIEAYTELQSKGGAAVDLKEASHSEKTEDVVQELIPLIKSGLAHGDEKEELINSAVNIGYSREDVEKAMTHIK